MPNSTGGSRTTTTSSERTRGGWVPTGVNASRRERRSERSQGRGDETEAQLIEAARQVFADRGYYDARIQDILEILGLSRGAFYVYFANKREIFDRVHVDVLNQLSQAIAGNDGAERIPPVTDSDFYSELVRSNTRFLKFYLDHWAILRSIDQVTSMDVAAADRSAENRRFHIRRVSRLIVRWQAAGLADNSVDPEAAAVALITMLSGTAHFMARGELNQDADQLGNSLSDLWARSLGFRH